MTATADAPSTVPSGPPDDQPDWSLNKPVFLTAALITLAVTVWCVALPDNAYSTLESVVGWVSTWFGWYYIALTTAVLAFVLYLRWMLALAAVGASERHWKRVPELAGSESPLYAGR